MILPCRVDVLFHRDAHEKHDAGLSAYRSTRCSSTAQRLRRQRSRHLRRRRHAARNLRPGRPSGRQRLAAALHRLGVKPGERVGTFCWNYQEHLEAYFAVPCMGAVLHTLNIRLFPEQIAYIVNHAEDRVIIRRRLAASRSWRRCVPKLKTVRHFIVIGDGSAFPGQVLSLRRSAGAGKRPSSPCRRSTSAAPPRCATPAAPPAIRRASSTAIARSICTRWRRRRRPLSGLTRRDRVLVIAADVSRQRLGHSVRRLVGRRGPDSARADSCRPSRLSRLIAPSGRPSPAACRRSGTIWSATPRRIRSICPRSAWSSAAAPRCRAA